MTVAFVVLAHDEPETLNLLLEQLRGFPTVLHVDKKAYNAGYVDAIESSLRGEIIVNPQPRCVHWGGYSMVEAMMDSLSLLLVEGDRRVENVAFLSGRCFPLRPVSEFAEHLQRSDRPVHVRGFDLGERRSGQMGMERVTKRHYLDGPVGHLRAISPRWIGGLVRRGCVAATASFQVSLPDAVHVCGSQWTAIPVQLATDLVRHYEAGGFDYLRHAFAPDEIAVPTYVFNTGWKSLSTAGNPEPATGETVAAYANFHWVRSTMQGDVNFEDVREALSSEKFFIRKLGGARASSIADSIVSEWATKT